MHLFRHLNSRIVLGHRLPAPFTAPSTGGFQASESALLDQPAFKLGQGGKNVKNQFAGSGGRVNGTVAKEFEPQIAPTITLMLLACRKVEADRGHRVGRQTLVPQYMRLGFSIN